MHGGLKNSTSVPEAMREMCRIYSILFIYTSLLTSLDFIHWLMFFLIHVIFDMLDFIPRKEALAKRKLFLQSFCSIDEDLIELKSESAFPTYTTFLTRNLIFLYIVFILRHFLT